MYISAGQGQTAPEGQSFAVYRNEGVSARTWLSPFLRKSELVLYLDTTYQGLHSDI